MTGAVTLRRAVPADAERLSEIAFSAKAHWGYPAEWLETWRGELTFDAATVERDWTWVAQQGERLMAVISMRGLPPELEIGHLWVEPRAMGRGLGRRLLEAAAAHARQLGARRLRIVSDPNAEPFYVALGARRIGEVPSRPADRTLPLLVIDL